MEYDLTISFFSSFLICLLSTPLFIRVANRLKLVDDPNLRKHPAHTHSGIIPRGGGMPIVLSLIITALIFIDVNKIIVGILVGALLIVLMGIADDRWDLSPYIRFVLNIIIAIVVISFGLGIPFISNPLGGVIRLDEIVVTINFFGTHKFLLIANLFSIIWLVALMNFINWSKGIDGQLPGFVAISAAILGILAYRVSAHDISTFSVAMLAFIVMGSYLGFLFWNFYPQKIMPGYGGGALAGYLLGVLSILSWGKLGTLLLVLAVPITDAIYVIARRLTSRRSPFRGDAGHFHHRLLQIGWGRRRVAFFYWLVSFVMGVSALLFKGTEKVFALFFVFIILAVFIMLTNRIKEQSS